MSELGVAMAGALTGLGVVVVWLGLRGGSALTVLGHHALLQIRPHMALIPLVGSLAFVLTGWVALAGAAVFATTLVPGVLRPRTSPRNDQTVVDAIATWTEQIRDTIAGARGLQEAIIATADRAPNSIRVPVSRLSAFIAYGRLDDGLRRFADDVRHPTADFVVAALSTAHHHHARDLGALLSGIAECAREESRMRSRIWVGRARTRTSLRIITGVVVAFVVGLLVFNREYLAPFGSTEGQIVLTMVMVLFASALFMMHRLARIEAPDRFVRKHGVSAG